MVNISKQDNGLVFVFTDSQRYLFNDGQITVPVDSLSLIVDESDLITLTKSASNDPFISFLVSESNFESKEAFISWFKENAVGAAGGVTEEEVNELIDEALEDYYTTDEIDAAMSSLTDDIATKQDTSAMTDYYTASETDSAINAATSGKADTTALTSVNDALTAHTNNSDIHVTSADKEAWNNKLDASAYTPTDLSQYWTSAQTDSAINAATSGKADTSAVTAISDSLTGKVDTTAITTSITSGSTDSEIPSAKAVFDAIPTGGTGGMDDDMEKLISSSLNDLNDRKIDALEVMTKYQRKGDYATNTALALKANSADVMTLTKSEENEFVAASALVDLNNKFGGLSLVKITESDYAALTTKDDNTLYIVVADPT